MNKKSRRLNSRGLSPVISAIILSGIVLVVGGSVWFYSQNASTIIAMNYVESLTNLMNEVTERFSIEHVSYSSSSHMLKIWIYNYGEVDITIDTYVYFENGSFVSTLANISTSKNLSEVDIPLNVPSGEEIAIKVISRRGNNAYHTYGIP